MDGIEPRVAKLEAHMEHARSDLAETRSNSNQALLKLATLDQKVNDLPTKSYIGWFIVTVGGALAAVNLFQGTITNWLSGLGAS